MKVTVVLVLLALAATPILAVDCPSIVWNTDQNTGGYAYSVGGHLRATDFDHDNKLDLVGTITTSSSSSSAVLHSWRGLGDGTFEAPVNLGTTDISDLRVIDLNNDGNDDLVMVNWNQNIIVRLGNGSGFNAATTIWVSYGTYRLDAGQFDNDNFADIVVSSLNSNLFVTYHGNGNGTFVETRRVTLGAPNDWATGIVSADFDQDGFFDVAVARRAVQLPDHRVEVYFRNANNTFTGPVTLAAGDFADYPVVADFDENGRPDFVVSNWNDGRVNVYLNQGSRNFTRLDLTGSFPRAGAQISPVAVGDVNGDSHKDVVMGAINGGSITTYLGNGNGTFRSPSRYVTPVGNVNGIVIGDFDGGGDMELAFGGYQRFMTADSSCATYMRFFSDAPMVSTTQPAPLRAYLSGFSALTPQPRGTVTFKEGLIVLGTADVDTNGIAQLDYLGLSVGSHTLTAEFSGNAQLAAATAPAITQKVTTNTTTLTLNTPASSTYGTPYQFSVVLKQNGVAFEDVFSFIADADREIFFLSVANGTVSRQFTPGQHTITTRFIGDEYRPPSNVETRTFTTEKATPTFTKSGTLTVRNGTAHTLTFSVTGPANTTPTDTVQLLKGATLLGTATLGGSMQITTTLPRGAHEVTAVYSGDANFKPSTLAFDMTVMPNVDLAIDAHALAQTIAISAVVPVGTTDMTLYRRVAGTQSWGFVPGWTPSTELDPASLTRGVVYDYRLDATVSGVLQQSNIDSALLFNDPALGAGTVVKRTHFSELRDAINAFRYTAGLFPFNFDSSFEQPIVRASHIATMRTAVAEARSLLGLQPMTFADPSLAAGNVIKASHILELRSAVK